MEHGALPKKTAHTQNSSAHVIKQQKSTPHFVELFQCQIFFPSFLLDGMTSAPVGGLYWICLFFFPPPSLSLIYLFIICGVFWFFGRIFLFLTFFFLRVWWDDLSSSGSESASTISLLLFSWFALKWKKKRRRHSWIEMKTDGRNALEALRNENDGRMCQNVNGLNSHSICQTMWNN